MSQLPELNNEHFPALTTEEKKHIVFWIEDAGKHHGFSVSSVSDSAFLVNERLLIQFYKSEIPIQTGFVNTLFVPVDFLYNSLKTNSLIGIISTKLQLNQSVFARNCTVERISRKAAEAFLNEYHLMGYTAVHDCIGLYYKGELLAVAGFSKGRQLNRLAAGERSYELVRFACKQGYSISGGLSKCIKAFTKERNPADIMTYIDKQFYSGQGFYKIGFELHSESSPLLFYVDANYKRVPVKKNTEISNQNGYYTWNIGNLKLVLKIKYK